MLLALTPITAYVLHQGSAGNAFYTLFPKRPRVTTRTVTSERDGTPQPLYESPDPFVFNFCLFGTEKLLRFRLPLGASVRLTMQVDELTPAP